jgi:hypothetical protein
MISGELSDEMDRANRSDSRVACQFENLKFALPFEHGFIDTEMNVFLW